MKVTTKNKRFMLSVTKDIEVDTADVKQRLFYDKPYSEMYRQLIRIGLDSLKSKGMSSNNYTISSNIGKQFKSNAKK